MPTSVEPRIRTIAGVTSDGTTKFVTNGNATDYVNVRLTDGSAFYTATSSGGGATTTVNIGSYGGTATTLGQKAMAASQPVVIASDQSSVSVGITVDAVGLAKESTAQSIYGILSDTTSTIGASVPTKAIYVGFRDLSANLNFARVFGNNANIGTQSGNIIGTDSFLFVKNGASWEPLNGIGSNGMTVTGSNITVASMPTTNVSVTGQPISVNASQNGAWFVTSNVSNTINANVTAAQTIAGNFKAQIDNSSWGGTSTTLGNKSMAASVPVTMASDQTNYGVNASQSGAWFTTSNVSNTVTVTQTIPTNFQATINNASWGRVATTLGNKSMAASVPVTMASDQVAFPVNASQAGAWFVTANVSNTINANVTAAQSIPSNFQDTSNINSYGGTATTLGRKAMASSVPVTIASDQGSYAVTSTSNLNSYGGTATTLGQKAMSASAPVVFASDQTALTITNVSNATVYQATASNLNVMNWRKENTAQVLTAINTTYDNNLSTATSADVSIAGYRTATFAFQLSATATPTDFTIKPQYKSSTGAYYPILTGFLGKWIYDDTSVATNQSIAVKFPLPDADTINVVTVATGVTSANKFVMTAAEIRLGT